MTTESTCTLKRDHRRKIDGSSKEFHTAICADISMKESNRKFSEFSQVCCRLKHIVISKQLISLQSNVRVSNHEISIAG